MTERTQPVGAMTAPYSPPENVQGVGAPAYRIRHNPSKSVSWPWRIERRVKFLFFFWIWEDVDGWSNLEETEKDLQKRVAQRKLALTADAQKQQILLYDSDGNRI